MLTTLKYSALQVMSMNTQFDQDRELLKNQRLGKMPIARIGDVIIYEEVIPSVAVTIQDDASAVETS